MSKHYEELVEAWEAGEEPKPELTPAQTASLEYSFAVERYAALCHQVTQAIEAGEPTEALNAQVAEAERKVGEAAKVWEAETAKAHEEESKS